MAAPSLRGRPHSLWLLPLALVACRSSGLGVGADAASPAGSDAEAVDAAVAKPVDAGASVADAAEIDAGAVDGASGDAAADPTDAGESGDTAPALGQILCKGGKAMLPTEGTVDSIVVTPDGTIYYTDGDTPIVTRIRPGMTEEKSWVRFFGGGLIGITYDSKRKRLYAGERGRVRVAVIDLNGAPWAIEQRAGGGGIYGLTMGEDDALYYLEESAGALYRIAIEGWVLTQVTTGIPGRPHGLAFGPDHWLYVTQMNGPEVWRIKIEGGKEVMREKFATVGRSHGKGIAFDDLGRLYVTAEGMLSQFGRDGSLQMEIPSGGGGLEFGAGELGCSDLYVGSAHGMQVHTLRTRGLNVPWHRWP